jgi:hypothetical protein
MIGSTPAKVLADLFADTKPAGARGGGEWNERQIKFKIYITNRVGKNYGILRRWGKWVEKYHWN